MGEAFTAEINDVNSLYYNPAGLGSLKYPSLSLFHNELIEDSRFENISIAYPLWGGYIGFAESIFWVPEFEKINIYGIKTGDVQFYNNAITLGYAYDLEFMYIGASMKYIYQKIDTLDLHSFAVDVGVLKGMYLYTPFDAPIRNFHVGISLLNLGTKALNDPLPRTLRIGLSYKFTKWLGINIDISENLIDISDIYDFIYGFDESFKLYLGMEMSWLEIFSLRAGYKFNDGGGLKYDSTYTFGLGFNYVIRNVTFTVDASYSDSGVFGPTYSFNVLFKLIPKVVTIQDKRDAEYHYKEGIRAYVADDIERALKEFKTTKDYNPYHRNIKKKIDDLEELLRLKKENERLEREAELERLEREAEEGPARDEFDR